MWRKEGKIPVKYKIVDQFYGKKEPERNDEKQKEKLNFSSGSLFKIDIAFFRHLENNISLGRI